MRKIPSTHTSIEIDLTKYGCEGRIVMSTPDVLRMTAMQNTVYDYILTDAQIKEMERLEDYERASYLDRLQLKRYPTVALLTVLCCITEAPFHINDYTKHMELDVVSFTTYIADKLELYNELLSSLKQIECADPLSK